MSTSIAVKKAAPTKSATEKSQLGGGGGKHGQPQVKRKQSISIEPIAPLSLNQIEVSTASLMQRTREVQLIHPEILRLALRFGRKQLLGSTDRCLEMLRAFRLVIQGYHAPANIVISRHLDTWFRPQIAYLVSARQLAVPMGHAIRFLKLKISQLSPECTEEEAKSSLLESIDGFVRDRYISPRNYIVETGLKKIKPNDVIITFARSTMVEAILLAAQEKKIPFRVIVVDSLPYLEGQRLLQNLSDAGVDVTYCHLEALGPLIPSATKVFVGASALFSNGSLLSRAGTALVCLLARQHNLPVIVAAQASKFSDRVQGVQAMGVSVGAAMYDVTPAEYLTMIITEMGMLPVTSVPVVLREYNIAQTNII